MPLLPSAVLMPGALLRRARRLHAAGRLDAALAAADAALAKLERRQSSGKASGLSGRDLLGEARLARGRILLQAGDRARAVEALLSAPGVALEPDLLAFLTGELLERRDGRPPARRIYLDYLAALPGIGPSEHLQRNLVRLAKISAPDLRHRRDLDESRRWNQAVAGRYNRLAWPRLHLGQIAALRGEWEVATDELGLACNLAPDDAEARRLLAYSLARLGRFEHAQAQLDRLLAKTPERRALLLRGHVLRRLGNPAAAARDLGQATSLGPLPDSQALAFAEVLFCTGDVAAARRVSDEGSAKPSADPRWRLFAAAVAQVEGRFGEALALSQTLVDDPQLGGQAVARVLALIGAEPQVPGSHEALDAVPEAARGDSYWTLLGDLHLAAGRQREALAAWNQVAAPVSSLASRRSALLRHYLASLYRAGDDAAVVALVRDGLAALGAARQVAPIVEAALTRQVRQIGAEARGRATEGALRQALEALHTAQACLPSLAGSRRIALLCGLLHACLGEHASCVEALALLDGPGEKDWETAATLARSALYLGDLPMAASALAAAPEAGPRWHRLAAAHAAARGDWPAAASHLDAAVPDGIPVEVRLASYVLAGRLDEVDSSAGDSSAGLYYRAAAALLRHQFDLALPLLDDLAAVGSLQPAARRLRGWVMLEEARESLRRRRRQEALASLVTAIELWPEEGGPSSLLAGAEEAVLPVLLAAGLRQRIQTLLEARALAAGHADPATCRHLALFHLAEGSRRAAAGDFAAAFGHRERSVAYLSATLAHFVYLEAWAQERFQVYGTPAAAEAIVSLADRVVRHYEGVFQYWTELMEKSGQSAEAARVAELALALRAERHGARLLAEIGGAPIAAGGRRVSTGPTYLALAGLAAPFGEWMAQLPVRRSPSSPLLPGGNVFELLMRLVEARREEDPAAVDPALKEQIERTFSSLRVADVLYRDGQLGQALEHVRRTERRCFPLAALQTCTGAQRSACPRAAERFVSCNPAFAGPDGGERFSQAAGEFELTVLFELGRQAIASAPQRLAEGIGYWHEALERAAGGDRRDQVAGRITEMVLGRIQVLTRNDREEEAIELLEAACEERADGQLQGALATLYAQRAIAGVNERDAWQQGVADLQRARQLSPHSAHINLNLIRALQGRSHEIHEQDSQGAAALLREALALAAEELARDPDNKQLQEAANQTRAGLAQLQLDPAKLRGENLIEAFMQTIPAGAARLSTHYHNQGLAKAKAGDLDGAIRVLEKALDLEPGSPVTRTALVSVLNRAAVERANRQRFAEALAALDRAMELAPEDPHLLRNRRAIGRASELEALTRQKPSPEGFLRLMQLLQDEND